MLNTLKASKRSWRAIPSLGRGMLLNMEKSMLTTADPRYGVRPRFPNEPEGTVKAQGLNHVAGVRVASAALPPCEIVFWHRTSGLAGTGPGWNGSAMMFGRPYPVAFCALTPPLPEILAMSPVVRMVNGWPERA